MRWNRMLYATLLITTFIFVDYYGGKVPYMLFYIMLALPIVSFFHIITGLFMLKFEQSLNSNFVVKEDNLYLKVIMLNKGLFMLPFVKVKFIHSSALKQQPSIKHISILPFSKREYRFEHTFKYRGHFELGVRTIEVQDFLGIFKFVRRNRQPLCVTVLPKIIEIDEMELNTHYLSDQRSNPNSIYEDVSVVDEVNKYNYGDSLKKVHWKLTAKLNELMVKKFHNTAGSNVIFIADLKKNPFDDEANARIEDKHIETIVAVLRYCLIRDASVKLIYQDEEIQTIECNRLLDFETAYQSLAKVNFNQEISFVELIDNQVNFNSNKPNILLSTSEVNLELYDILYSLIAEGYSIGLIYISTEELTGEKKPDIELLLVHLIEVGIRVYKVNFSEDIKTCLIAREGKCEDF